MQISSDRRCDQASQPLQTEPFEITLSVTVYIARTGAITLSLARYPNISARPFSDFDTIGNRSTANEITNSTHPNAAAIVTSSLASTAYEQSPPRAQDPKVFPIALDHSPSTANVFSNQGDSRLLSERRVHAAYISPYTSHEIEL